jgi:hypothetical protein
MPQHVNVHREPETSSLLDPLDKAVHGIRV